MRWQLYSPTATPAIAIGANNYGTINHMPYRFIIRGPLEPRINPIPAAIRTNGAGVTCVECHGPKGRFVSSIDLFFPGWFKPFK